MPNAIITYLDINVLPNFMNDFLGTLFTDGKFGGELHVLTYDLTDEQREAIENTQRGKVFTHPTRKISTVPSQRVRDIAKLLRELNNPRVMTIDAGDVWFQAPFEEVFDLCDGKIGCVIEKYNANENTMAFWCRRLEKEQEIETVLELDGAPCRTSGMICGSLDIMRRLFDEMELQMTKFGPQFFGADMLAFNLAAVKLTKEGMVSVAVSPTYSYIIFPTSNNVFIGMMDSKIYDGDKNIVKIVHNAGGEHNESRIFKEGRKSIDAMLVEAKKQPGELEHVELKSFEVEYPKVSILIPEAPNDRSRRYTKMCKQAIELYTNPTQTPYEIIVEDRGTSTEAANLLLERANCEFVVYLSNDAFVTQNWLLNMHLAWKSIKSAGQKPGQLSTYFTGSPGNVQDLTTNQYVANRIWACPRIVWVCVMMRKDDFKAIGGMDSTFKGSYSDDDVSVRFLRAGFKNFICPQITLHIGRVGFDGDNQKFLDDMAAGEAIIKKKWGDNWRDNYKLGTISG